MLYDRTEYSVNKFLMDSQSNLAKSEWEGADINNLFDSDGQVFSERAFDPDYDGVLPPGQFDYLDDINLYSNIQTLARDGQ